MDQHYRTVLSKLQTSSANAFESEMTFTSANSDNRNREEAVIRTRTATRGQA